jgi:hypothetical protein
LRLARIFSIRNGVRVHKLRASDVRKICPPPSLWDPSIVIIVYLPYASLYQHIPTTIEDQLLKWSHATGGAVAESPGAFIQEACKQRLKI